MLKSEYELFIAIVQQGSMAAAARSLNLSRSILSKRLARLEDRLGVQLLHRTTRSLALTSEGQSFYEDVTAIVSAAKDAEARVSSKRGILIGELRLRTVSSLGRKFIAPFLAPFLEQNPDLRVNFIVEDQPIDLLTNRIDVEVTFAPPSWKGAVIHKLARDRRILCASPEYIAKNGAPRGPSDLYNHDIVASPASLPWRLKGPEGLFLYEGKSRIISNSSELPGAFALAGLGIALRPIWAMIDDLRAGRLMRVLPRHESSSHWSIAAVYHPDRIVSPNVKAVVAYLKDCFASLDQDMEAQLAEIEGRQPKKMIRTGPTDTA